MMIQQEYPYGFSLMETSLSYDNFDYFQNFVVSGSGDPNPFSSSSATLSSSIEELQSYSPQKLSSLRQQDGSGEEPPRKRRRKKKTRSDENKIKEKEKQRMNHIAVERNRRRQMNHFLSILKSMMPLAYSHRSDQASIIEGAINYLKKQEQLLQSLQVQSKATKSPNIFSDFFTFPQYSTATATSNNRHHEAAVADVEVSMMERQANIKVLTKTIPRLLFKIINEFCSLGLTIRHLNLTTSKDMSLFTICVKVAEDSQLTTTANEVAHAVHEVVRRIHKEN